MKMQQKTHVVEVHRDARTGKFVPEVDLIRRPDTTVREHYRVPITKPVSPPVRKR